MHVGIIGLGEHVTDRERTARAQPGVTRVSVWDDLPAASSQGAGAAVGPLLGDVLARSDVVFVAGPTSQHYALAEAAAKIGVHVFLEWPPATSIRECEAMIALAEEAGIEIGISRPLRFHPALGTLPAAWRADLILMQQTLDDETRARWTHQLANAVDLACALARSSSIQRVDADLVRSEGPWPDAVAFGLRFHSGAYAQGSLRHGTAAPEATLYAGGSGFQMEASLAPPEQPATPTLIAAETRAFLQALAGRRPPPVSVLDGLHTMRLLERVMNKLR